jgi:hypothetical protein
MISRSSNPIPNHTNSTHRIWPTVRTNIILRNNCNYRSTISNSIQGKRNSPMRYIEFIRRGNHPEGSLQHSKKCESLKSRMIHLSIQYHQYFSWCFPRNTFSQFVCADYRGCRTRYRTRLAGGPLLRVATIRRTTDTFPFISHTTNVPLFKFRYNIFIGVRIIKEIPGSVASGTHCIFVMISCCYTIYKL